MLLNQRGYCEDHLDEQQSKLIEFWCGEFDKDDEVEPNLDCKDVCVDVGWVHLDFDADKT